MPVSEIARAALAQGGTQAGSGLINGIFGWIGQRKQRNHERAMYERQLADNRQNWEMENLYNSPAQQMQRLKDAGLNPNLVYGNGATAMGGSINPTDMTISDQSKSLMPFGQIANAPMTAINALYDLRIKDAQANLLGQKARTEHTMQKLNETNEVYKQTLQYGEMLKNSLGDATYQEMIKQIFKRTEILQAELDNTRADTELKQVSSNLGGKRATGQDIQNQMDQQQLDMYKDLGLPPQFIDQILKTAPFLAPLFNSFKRKK